MSKKKGGFGFWALLKVQTRFKLCATDKALEGRRLKMDCIPCC